MTVINWRIRYLEYLRASVQVVTLPLGQGAEYFTLERVFQPLRLRRDPPIAEDHARHDPAAADQPDQRQEPIIAETGFAALQHSPTRHLVILGGPGSGKTTLIKDMLLRASTQAQHDSAAPLPILISLPDLARAGLDMETYLADYVAYLGVDGAFAAELAQTLQRGAGFCCLDGLDEVTPVLRPECIRLVNRLATHWGGTWVVGSRFVEYKGGQFGPSFAEWELLPLDHRLRHELVARLFLAHAPTMPPPEVRQMAQDFVAKLAAHPQARSWGNNPLLLSLAAIVYTRAHALPPSRVGLYGEIITALLARRSLEPGEREDLSVLLGELALALWQQQGRVFTRKDLRALLVTLRPTLGDGAEREAVLDRVLTCGLLEAVAQETYGFLHQTFQEYLAGAALAAGLASEDAAVSDRGWALAWAKRTFSRWTEVLGLMAGLLVSQHGPQGMVLAHHWVTALATQATEPEGDPGHLGLALALRCAGEASVAAIAWRAEGGVATETLLVRHWVAALQDASESNSRWQHLAKLGEDIQLLAPQALRDGTAALIETLHGQSREQAGIAAAILGLLGEEIPVADLVAAWEASQALPHTNITTNFRNDMMKALGNAGLRAPLAVFCRSLAGNYSVQEILVHRFSLGDREVIPALLAIASDITAPIRARTEAITVLGELHDHVPIEPLVALTQDAELFVVRSAIQALAQWGERCPPEPLIAAMHLPQPPLDAIAPSRSRSSIVRQQMYSHVGQIRVAACKALGKLGQHAPLALLTEKLRGGDDVLRVGVAKTFRHLAPYASAAPLLAALEDEVDLVRYEAVTSLLSYVRQVPAERLLAIVTQADPTIISNGILNLFIALIQTGVPIPFELHVRELAQANLEPRSAIIDALGRYGRDVALAPILAALHDATHGTEIHTAMCLALGKSGRPEAVAPLIQQLDNVSWAVRSAAVEALAMLGEPGNVIAPEAIAQSFAKSDHSLMQRALSVLGEVAPDAALTLLQAFLAQQADPDGMLQALVTPTYSSPPLPDALIAPLFHMAKGTLRGNLVGQLARQGALPPEQFLALIRGPDALVSLGQIKSHAPHYLETLPQETLRELAQIPLLRDRPLMVRLLAQYNDPMLLDTYLAGLQDPDPEVRCKAIACLAEAHDQVPWATFVPLTHDPEPFCVAYALQALGRYGQAAPRDILLNALATSNTYIRTSAFQALAATGQDMPLDVLRPYVQSPEKHTRLSALALIAQHLTPEELQAICQNDPDLDVRLRAAEALLQRGLPLALLSLLPESRIEHPIVTALAKHLDQVPWESLAALLGDESAEVRKRAAKLLVMKGEVVPQATIMTLLQDAEPGVRLAVLEALIGYPRPFPHEALRPLLAHSWRNIRVAAAHLLIILGDEPAIPVLWEALLYENWEDSMPYRVAKAFQAMGKDAPADLMVQALGGDDIVFYAMYQALVATHPEALQQVRAEAEQILRERQSGAMLGAHLQVMLAAAIGQMQRVPAIMFVKLGELLEWPFEPVQMAAIEALGKIRRNIPDALIRQLMVMRRASPSLAIRDAADDALAAILVVEAGMEDEP
jgi:HEAT repeat protein